MAIVGGLWLLTRNRNRYDASDPQWLACFAHFRRYWADTVTLPGND